MKSASIALALLTLAMLALGWSALQAGSADLKNIDRTIIKEPKYASQPHYALLVFGQQAKTRVWLVLDGDVLYVDRNGNGDLTEANERVDLDVEAAKRITRGPGEFKKPNVFNIGQIAGECLRLEVWVRDDKYIPSPNEHETRKKDREERRIYGWEHATLSRSSSDAMGAQLTLFFCQNAKDAQVSHLSGPLTFVLRSEPTFTRGQFGVCIGTPGLPTRNSRYPVFAPLICTPQAISEVPVDVHPVANFEFPHLCPLRNPCRFFLCKR